jgi:hypothetical protein
MLQRTSARRSGRAWVTSWVLLAGCTGQVYPPTGTQPPTGGEPGGSPGAPPPPPGGSPGTPGTPGAMPPEMPDTGPPCVATQKAFAPARLWQLSDAQYVNVVRDVFGITLTGADAEIVSEGAGEQYSNYSEGVSIGSQAAPNYQTAAGKVAAQAVARMGILVGSAAPSTTQVRTFITTKVARAWRRPVTPQETAALMNVYATGLPDAATAFSLMLQAALQAPSFLYRTELGTNAATAQGPVQLTPYELASALSFFFLETAPDDQLWARAQAGDLADPTVLAGEVDRLLARPAARSNLTLKASYWLGLEALRSKLRDKRLYPAYTDTLKASLYQSVKAFLEDTLWNGTFRDLFTSSKVYVNQELGRVYQIPGAVGIGLTPVMAGPERSAGILTQPGLLVAANKWGERGDPIHRGLMIYNSFVCGGQIPPPPADAATVAASMNGTEREKADMRAALPSCRPCHYGFDPLGLTFERYDALGRYSETRLAVLDSDTGVTSFRTTTTPIDSSSVLSEGLGPDLAGPVGGIDELAAKLADDGVRVGFCATRRLAEYGLGHNPDAENSCELKAVRLAFVKSGSFSEFFRALALSPGFRTRDPLVN